MTKKRPPNLGLILDGSRRWAKKRGLLNIRGYSKSLEVLDEFLNWCEKKRVKHVVLYIMSHDNYLSRPRKEIDYLFKSLAEGLGKAKNRNVKVKVWGEYKKIHNKSLADMIDIIMRQTEEYIRGTLHILFNWFTEKTGAETTIPQLDLVIRTGGNHRLSGFIPYNCRYAEILFEPKLFPETTKEDFDRWLKWFYSQERKWGR